MATSPPFIRPNFFAGRLLTAADYQAEQNYHRRKLQLQNRITFGMGVVTGLRVSIANDQLSVSPGLAYDCQGNELLLTDVHHEPILQDTSLRFVTITYKERPIQLAPVLDWNEHEDEAESRPTYIEETVDVSVAQTCAHLSPGTMLERVWGCDTPHAVCLARIRWQGNGWSVRSMAWSLHTSS